jgi:hypothetical protein
VALEMGMIPDATIDEVMNLFLNLGLEYLKDRYSTIMSHRVVRSGGYRLLVPTPGADDP